MENVTPILSVKNLSVNYGAIRRSKVSILMYIPVK